MPHATLPLPGFQAFILCGPGASIDTFTSHPADFPKAIVPIANRPMVWYPLDWCYRCGISDIYLITPPESNDALEAAMSQNPHLTSLPLPRPTIIAPPDLTTTSGTAEIFRQPEVKRVVTSDFIVLPCDLVSELEGTALIQEWMVQQASLDGSTGGIDAITGNKLSYFIGGEKSGRRGALAMWYETKGEHALKTEETDFIITVPTQKPVATLSSTLIHSNVSQLATALPTDSLNDIASQDATYHIRHKLLRKYGRINLRTSVRDAHVYLLPFWALEFMQNDKFDTLGEDVLGWWAKATWQKGLSARLGLDDILRPSETQVADGSKRQSITLNIGLDSEDFDVAAYSTTTFAPKPPQENPPLASRVKHSASSMGPMAIPPILAYVHPAQPGTPLVKRVDTSAALLEISLRIARLPVMNAENGDQTSCLAHSRKIVHPESIPKMTRIEEDSCLVAENVTVGERCNIKETVIGAGCTIGPGTRLTRCLLMDDVVIGENVSLTGCILGRRCRLEGGPRKSQEKTQLDNCEVQGGYVVSWGTEAKGEKLMAFEGLDDTIDMGDAHDSDEAIDDES